MSYLLSLAGATMLLPQGLLHVANPEASVTEPTPVVQMVRREIVQPLPPPPTLEEESNALALALYFEGRTNEPEEGLQAIASVIVNRTKSLHFPNTITEVVSQGSNPGKIKGGCQFSFMCDKYPEDIQLLCELRPLDLQKHWGEKACEKRWLSYKAFAENYIKNGKDNTGNALMYYATWMKRPPYWHVDLVKTSIVRRGSHFFARSKRFKEIALQ